MELCNKIQFQGVCPELEIVSSNIKWDLPSPVSTVANTLAIATVYSNNETMTRTSAEVEDMTLTSRDHVHSRISLDDSGSYECPPDVDPCEPLIHDSCSDTYFIPDGRSRTPVDAPAEYAPVLDEGENDDDKPSCSETAEHKE